MHPQLHLRILVAALFLTTRLAAQQPAAFEWLDAVKSPKNEHTISFLRADAGGFYLLRWREAETDFTGKSTPAHPLLVHLSPAGELLSSKPIPGLEPGSGNTFHFAVPNESVALFAYETAEAGFVQRIFDLSKQDWTGPSTPIFPTNGAASAAYKTSGSAARPEAIVAASIGRIPKKGLSFALFDGAFQLLRQGAAPWPEKLGRSQICRVFCTDDGALLLATRNSASGESLVSAPPPPQVWRADGLPVWGPEDLSKLSPFSLSIFLLKENSSVFEVFYPTIGKKFASTLVFSQNGKGAVIVAGLAGDTRPDLMESYFIYQINTAAASATMLQNTALPAVTHRAFQSEKDAAAKMPISNLRLRWLDHSTDGRAWLLAETENASRSPVNLDAAALLRLDSTFKITAARRIEKYQRAAPDSERFFGSLAAAPSPKGWWTLWNKGDYPSASLLLTDCKTNGESVDYELAAGARVILALLPHTQYLYDGKWYFAGESANGDRFGIGVLKRAGKQ